MITKWIKFKMILYLQDLSEMLMMYWPITQVMSWCIILSMQTLCELYLYTTWLTAEPSFLKWQETMKETVTSLFLQQYTCTNEDAICFQESWPRYIDTTYEASMDFSRQVQ